MFSTTTLKVVIDAEKARDSGLFDAELLSNGTFGGSSSMHAQSNANLAVGEVLFIHCLRIFEGASKSSSRWFIN
jgi:hypothetical protein